MQDPGRMIGFGFPMPGRQQQQPQAQAQAQPRPEQFAQAFAQHVNLNRDRPMILRNGVHVVPSPNPSPNPNPDCKIQFGDPPFCVEHKDELSNDLAVLWKSKHLADVTLHCSDGGEIKAHKLILSARSPYFHAMFESGMKESTASTIQLEEISTTTLNSVLEFMYTGRLNLAPMEASIEEMGNIIKAADMYQIEILKSGAFTSLVNRISIFTVGEIVVLAHTYNAENSHKSTIQKFLAGKINELSKMETFQNLIVQHPLAFSQITYFDAK